MAITGADIGNYLDPNLINSSFSEMGTIDPVHPSCEGGIMGFPGGEVPLTDGRIAIVDSNGIIVGYK